ncbi:MAG: endonuclease domain-containing protein [Candidatus Pacebacteria bacterium]|nr:endonuclease domain-containing protein [Candidatus Paceibacterota bacterium]
MYNDKQQENTRKKLRKEMTPQEIMMWSKLKAKQLGVKFRRQFGIGAYILDFYCPEKRIAIEIDGSQHFQKQHHYNDKVRDEFLATKNIIVLRFSNDEVNKNIDGVLMKIQETINTPQSRSLGTPRVLVLYNRFARYKTGAAPLYRGAKILFQL